jgi:hypothetical protein
MRLNTLSLRAAYESVTGLLTVLVALTALVVPASARASFALTESDVRFTNQDGSSATQAGSHPFAMTTSFQFAFTKTPEGGGVVEQAAKDIDIAQIPGLVGDPAAVHPCTTKDFLTVVGNSKGVASPDCPDSAAVGFVAVTLSSFSTITPLYSPVYDLEAPPGAAAELGFFTGGVPVEIELGVNDVPPYNVEARVTNISQLVEVLGTQFTLWGVPADPSHDPLRGKCLEEEGGVSGGDCPVSGTVKPFLTLPSTCDGPLSTSFIADSWENPGSWIEANATTHDNSEPPTPQGMTGCGKLSFNPTIGTKPTTVAASSPTGLEFSLDVDNEGLTSPTGISQSDIKKVAVTLPEAMSVNPALAEGLGACSEADLEQETISSAPGEGCPNESKIGTVEVETPLLEQTLKGSLFLAKQNENPFGSLLALYVVVKNPETGILLKLPGKVEPNATTGQLVSVFDNLPQLPFSHFRLSFRQGQRSPLVTPSACGSYTTQAKLTPWSGGAPVTTSSTFQLTTGVGGSACSAGGVPPFKPDLVAGTANNAAGSYSPLDIRITRNDGEQEITGFGTQLPEGLTANLSGVPFCSEADIALAKTKTGAQEEAEPACPTGSEIGQTLVGVGVGSILAYTPGKVYMAGPYEGAPFSIAAITSAKVGPFDLGTVVVHLPLQINPVTAEVSIPAGAADQIPHIIDGIVVHVRDIRVYVDRPNFTINPTSCTPTSFAASVIGSGLSFTNSADDMPANVTDPFQAANCANLKFTPKFAVSTPGKTSKADGAGLAVKLSFPTGSLGTETNIAKVKVDLPKQLPSRLTTLQKACLAATFEANPAACPAASVIGHARAITPILPVPLEGPAYFVSHGGEAFPSLVMVLQGYGVTIDLTASTFISKAGITSSTFKAVPDQPVSSFELTLPEGKYSALAANGNLCSSKLVMPTAFTGQNGLEIHQSTPIGVTGCPKAKILSRAQKLQKALKACKKDGKKAKRAGCERQARKKYGSVKAKK